MSTPAMQLKICPTISVAACRFCGAEVTESGERAEVPGIVRALARTRYPYARCGSCGSIQLLDQLDLDTLYSTYPLKQHELNLHTRLAYRQRLGRLRAIKIDPTWKILDYGCGAGLFVQFLRERGFQHVQGFDPYVPAFSDQSVLSETYDLVCCQDVIEHVEAPAELIAQLAACVRPGGFLEIGTPRADGIDLAQEAVYRFEISAPYHLTVYSEGALTALLDDAGFTLQKIYRTFYFDVPAPFFNLRFIKAYFYERGSVLEAFFEPPTFQGANFLKILWHGLFGWVRRPSSNMSMLCKLRHPTSYSH